MNQLPAQVQQEFEHWREKCNETCQFTAGCGYHFERIELDNETGETYFHFTCDRSHHTCEFDDDFEILESEESCEINHVRQDDGQVIFEG